MLETGICDRHLDCRMDLEKRFTLLVELSMAVDWTEMETLLALAELVDSRILGVDAYHKTDYAIRKAVEKLKNPSDN